MAQTTIKVSAETRDALRRLADGRSLNEAVSRLVKSVDKLPERPADAGGE